ncbi:MAG: hypothetical protein KGL58_03465, partial [Pseudomonadota bacterium]|nr:hypothetical protein [Pseudomonadota bacterium]
MLLTVHLALAAPKQELQVIRKQIGALEQNRLSTKKTRTEILRAIKKSAISINNINHSLGLLNQKKQAVNAQLLSIKQNIRQISSTIITQQHNLDLQLLHQYESGKEEQARILFNGENAGSINRDLVYYHYLAEARSNAIQSLQTNIERLKQLNGLEESKNQQISAIQSREQKQQHQLLAEEAKHQKYAAELNQRIKTQDQEIARLHHDEQRLTLLIKKLNALRRQRMEKRHAVSINRKGIASNNYLPSGRYAGRDFVKLRGHLRLPVIGEIMNRFGSRRPETGTIWHGIFIKAPEGSPV